MDDINTSSNIFDEILKYCPYLKEVIENKINLEVEMAVREKDREIKELKSTVENLTATVLMGGK